jgi:TetR/AcrR family transcriptional regulator, fatty acid biosynthesis regulator
MTGKRAEQKEKTRRLIIDSALSLLNAEHSYASLSMREVCRKANIAAPSFYHHFKDMEELGLTLVDEAGMTLRQLMRKARKRIDGSKSVIKVSVETFMEFVESNPNIFRLLLRERSGTSKAFRAAVVREIKHFREELVAYITSVSDYPAAIAEIQADGMIILVFNAGAEALDASGAELSKLTDKTIAQMRYLAIGVTADQAARTE